MSKKKGITRREFLKKSTLETAAVAGLAGAVTAGPVNLLAAPVDRQTLTAAIGDTLIPTADGYPGYKRLETYGISKEVLSSLQGVTDAELETFNASSASLFGGKTFLDLGEAQRAEYLNAIIAGQKFPDKKVLDTLQKVYRLYRARVFTVFYQNFPEHKVKRDAQGVPILEAGDQHQIINPNTKNLVTGWDVANFRGPLSWEEEEARRARFMKVHWHDS